MPTDPASLPQHVVKAGYAACYDANGESHEDWMAHALAAALDALMDDEPVMVRECPLRGPGGMSTLTRNIRPADVLTAVLAREETPPRVLHRSEVDAIRERHKAGETTASLADDFEIPAAQVSAVVAPRETEA